MIDEIDAALRALLKDEALGGSEVEVVFDAPTKDWAARRNAPMVNAFLYDIREDMRKRTRGMVNEYDDHGIVVGRKLPPRFYNLSYLVTAWTQRPEDEHRLLAQMLMCFSNYDAMPSERLNGAIGRLGLPVEMKISLPPPEDRSFADVWTALGGELKPSIDVVLSVPLAPARTFPAGPPVKEPTLITLREVDGEAVDLERRTIRIAGEGEVERLGESAQSVQGRSGGEEGPGGTGRTAAGKGGKGTSAADGQPDTEGGASKPRARRRGRGMRLDLSEQGGADPGAKEG
jgi:hypothetical protein